MSIFHRTCFRSARFRPAIVAALLALALQAIAALPVQAQSGVPPFELLISRDYQQLPSFTGTPSNKVLFGSVIETQNNRPFIYLKNLSPETMTDFHFQIGSDLFHFDTLASGLINVKANPSNVPITATAQNNGDELLLDFGPAGLAQNDAITFQIRFASDSCPTCGLPSFQVALFNMCIDGSSMGPRGLVSADFEGGGSFGPSPWPDFPVSPYDEGHFAPLGSPPPVTDSFFPPTPVVPEPSSLLLGLIASCGMTFFSRRRASRRSA